MVSSIRLRLLGTSLKKLEELPPSKKIKPKMLTSILKLDMGREEQSRGGKVVVGH